MLLEVQSGVADEGTLASGPAPEGLLTPSQQMQRTLLRRPLSFQLARRVSILSTSRTTASTKSPRRRRSAFGRRLACSRFSTRIQLRSFSYLSCASFSPLDFFCLTAFDEQYKTRLTKADSRAFHRPPLQFPSNVALTFTKVRSSKKKKDKSGRKIKKSDGEALRTMGDISLRDTSNFLLWEYSVRFLS